MALHRTLRLGRGIPELWGWLLLAQICLALTSISAERLASHVVMADQVASLKGNGSRGDLVVSIR